MGLRTTSAITLVAAAMLATFASPLAAQDTLDDPLLEAKARELMETLRCLTCQSQSISDSDAPMAGDMRHQVRTRIAAGEDPEAVRQWLIARYGDYISYAPQVTGRTWPLFAIPVLLIGLALLILRSRLGARRRAG
jgi:cytochrome c-type biogenesis protein CcmH